MELLSEHSIPLHGRIDAPPSKSVTHRALLLAAMSEGRSVIRNPLLSGDTLSTLEAARLMGAAVEKGSALMVNPSLHQSEDVINANNSGTTARLFSSVCALLPGHAVITGDSSLRRRPMQPIIDAVKQLGGKAFSTAGNGRLPAVFGGRMNRSNARLRGDISSQFASSLAISCPMKDNDTEIRLTGGIQSLQYLKLTMEMVGMFGCRTVLEDSKLYSTGGGAYRGRTVNVPGDYSSAAFPLAAAAVTGGRITVGRLSNEFTQADSVITSILSTLGCSIRIAGDSVTVGSGGLDAADIDCSESPDLFPVTCILASAAKGKSRIKGSANLRHKETDRVETTCSMLQCLGVDFSASGETVVINGGRIRGGAVESHGDHRIAMAACVAGLASQKGCTVSDGESCSVSYPSFVSDLRSLGGKVKLK